MSDDNCSKKSSNLKFSSSQLEFKSPIPKKSLGQNFLKDINICRKIVELLNICSSDNIYEIGPGTGALTKLILNYDMLSYNLIEKDDYLASSWSEVIDSIKGLSYVSVNHKDALEYSWSDVLAPWKCIGNLPYNIASLLIWDLVSLKNPASCYVFMIQKEVALRITSKPNSKSYGALSVWVQSFMDAKLEFVVPPQVFFPRPKVDSAVITLRPNRRCSFEGQSNLNKLLKICFQKRRKQIGTIFKCFDKGKDILLSNKVSLSSRPESLSVEDFILLSKEI